jgi:hypothetical protein
VLGMLRTEHALSPTDRLLALAIALLALAAATVVAIAMAPSPREERLV